MRILLSTIGSRGDVQPLVALAVALRSRGAAVRLCLPPDFRGQVESLGLEVTTIGPELRSTARTRSSASPPTPEQRRQMIEGTVSTQFETILQAARECDAIVGATALQVAAPSVAERLGIPYVFAAYCPVVLPSLHHAPPALAARGPEPSASTNAQRWARDAEQWNAMWREPINGHRASLGLPSIDDVRSYVHTARPWLAADPALAPWPDDEGGQMFQTGAWTIDDTRPLDPEIDASPASGEPPLYFGFGSIRAPEGISRTVIDAARALGRRTIVSRGWADFSGIDGGEDCLVIGEVNQQALFRRVDVVVHHGGAGTTTTVAMTGTPQVVLPQIYDQHYWAKRIEVLGVGAGAGHAGSPTVESLTSALSVALSPNTVTRARALSGRMRRDGTTLAADTLLAQLGA
ncbi:MAG: glycosyltransferase [Vicinamibacterales bacterium]